MIAMALLLMSSAVALVGGLLPKSAPELEMKRVFPSLVGAHELARSGTATVFYLGEDELRTVALEWSGELVAAEFAERLKSAVDSAWAENAPVTADWNAQRNAFRQLTEEGSIPSITSATRETETLVLVRSDEKSLWVLPTEPGGETSAESGWQRAQAIEENVRNLQWAWSQ